ncbi:BTAD domain-containing putative transcriptional regulator [Actinoplanes sp. NPDC024001]|uniref:AfsR/SARP family transcriptional regulator n=1 Tax=Actinoplanes sp. NPDC024001 TaxID=3154598 RepID=UPI0033F9A120
MVIDVGVLGPVELCRDGVPVPLTGAPQRVLLARLALAAGRPVPVADLIDALWEGEAPENAVGNLHSYVSRLRRHTGGEAIRREPGGYRLDLPEDALDLRRAERLVGQARAQPPARAAATLAEALAVWRGDPLADVADRLVFAPDVARLSEWRHHLREEWLDRRLDAGEAAEALPEVEAIAAAEPLRERIHLLLMRALHATGRTPEALAVARAFRDRLAEDHGVDPSPALVDLQRRILSDDPALRPQPLTPSLRPQPLTPTLRPQPLTAGSSAGQPRHPTGPVLSDQPQHGSGAVPGDQPQYSTGSPLTGPPQPSTSDQAEADPAGRGQAAVGEDEAGPGERLPPVRVRRRADRFFGRRGELAAVREALATGRVTTLAGPGGVGKTRLMTEALTGDEFVVELAELSVPADVAAAVAGALGLRAAPRGGVAALAERLGAAPAVLVLDNCEHLLDAVRDLVDELVVRCPGLRVLATSRQRLDVAGERVLRLGPLPAEDQVALFCDRAALLRADFADEPQPRTRELAAEICRLVDGLPLAVELAARREAVFGLVHLRDRLGAGLHVLDPARGGDRATAVSATVEWSYRLLDPAAQRLLDRLAVCRGGFGVDALPYFLPGEGEQLLAELVDASLVTPDLRADPPRYRLLETVRHVGLSHLGPDGERQARDAHARWMLDHAAELVRRGRDRDPWTTPAMHRELANLQEALTWLGDGDDGSRLAALLAVIEAGAPDPSLTEQLARLAPQRVETESEVHRALAAGTAALISNRQPEADRLLSAVLDRMPVGHPLRWSALVSRISNAMFGGRADDVRADAERIVVDPSAPRWARATGVCCSALMDAYHGDPEAGRRWLEKYAAELHTEGLDGFVPFTRGELLAAADPERALAWYEHSIAASDRVNQVYMANVARVARAAVLIRLRRHREAVVACREVIAAVRSAGMTAQVWTMLRLTAELLADLGEARAAAMIVRAADADPLAPAVMGPDRDRLARLRTGPEEPLPGGGDAASITAFALAALARHAEHEQGTGKR